jgi:predicted ester cyclase
MFPSRELNSKEKENLELFQKTICNKNEFDNITAFNDVVATLGPPQDKVETSTRKVEIYKNINGSFKLEYSNEFITNPPYNGKPNVDKERSRSLVEQFIKEVLIDHNLGMLSQIASSNILLHPTAMPCEASYYGIEGIGFWLNSQWKSLPDLKIIDYFTVSQGDIVAVHWTAKGTSKDNFLMLPPSGKEVKYTGSSMYRIEKEKIAEIWETRNTLAIMKQINPAIDQGQHSH